MTLTPSGRVSTLSRGVCVWCRKNFVPCSVMKVIWSAALQGHLLIVTQQSRHTVLPFPSSWLVVLGRSSFTNTLRGTRIAPSAGARFLASQNHSSPISPILPRVPASRVGEVVCRDEELLQDGRRPLFVHFFGHPAVTPERVVMPCMTTKL